MAYNGWNSKETWLVNLWLSDLLVMYQEEGIEVTPDNIQELVENIIETETEGKASLLTDLLNCALGEIDYRELAKHYEGETV